MVSEAEVVYQLIADHSNLQILEDNQLDPDQIQREGLSFRLLKHQGLDHDQDHLEDQHLIQAPQHHHLKQHFLVVHLLQVLHVQGLHQVQLEGPFLRPLHQAQPQVQLLVLQEDHSKVHLLQQLLVLQEGHSKIHLLLQQLALQEGPSKIHLLLQLLVQPEDQFKLQAQQQTGSALEFHFNQPLPHQPFHQVEDPTLAGNQTDSGTELQLKNLDVPNNLEVLDLEMLCQEVRDVKIVSLQRFS